MTNLELNRALKDIKSYIGCYMSDELSKIVPAHNISLIINYDTSTKPGSHWVALYVQDNRPEYFDSFGLPPIQSVIDFCSNYHPIRWNSKQLQSLDEVVCGELAASFIKLRSLGHSFEEIINLFSHN